MHFCIFVVFSIVFSGDERIDAAARLTQLYKILSELYCIQSIFV